MPINAQGDYVVMIGLAESSGVDSTTSRILNFQIESVNVFTNINIFTQVGACGPLEIYTKFSINTSGKITVGSTTNITPKIAGKVELKMIRVRGNSPVSFVVVILGDCSKAN